MALVEKSVLVPYSAKQMFVLVDNVADYPRFLPWCGGASVISMDGDTVSAEGLAEPTSAALRRDAPKHLLLEDRLSVHAVDSELADQVVSEPRLKRCLGRNGVRARPCKYFPCGLELGCYLP